MLLSAIEKGLRLERLVFHTGLLSDSVFLGLLLGRDHAVVEIFVIRVSVAFLFFLGHGGASEAAEAAQKVKL